MKIVKTIVIAVATIFATHAAEAQVSVHARIRSQPPARRVVVVNRPVQHRTVVVRRPVSRTVVVNRPHRYRKVVSYRRYYSNNGWHRRPVYRYYTR